MNTKQKLLAATFQTPSHRLSTYQFNLTQNSAAKPAPLPMFPVRNVPMSSPQQNADLEAEMTRVVGSPERIMAIIGEAVRCQDYSLLRVEQI